MASLELPKGNPVVGFLREHALTGFFVNEFGKNDVELPDAGNARGFDIIVCGHELSIKTMTREGAVKVVWTVDQERVVVEISGNYQPDCDILLTQIYWGESKPSVFYIP